MDLTKLLINAGINLAKEYIKDTRVGYLVAEVESILDNIREKEIVEDIKIKEDNYPNKYVKFDGQQCYKCYKPEKEEGYKISSFTTEYDDYDLITKIYLDDEGFPFTKYKKKKKKSKKSKPMKTRKLFKNK